MWACEYVSMWACEDVRMWVCEDVSMWVCEHVSMWACEYVSLWVCEHVSMWVCEYVSMFLRDKCARIFNRPCVAGDHNWLCAYRVESSLLSTGGGYLVHLVNIFLFLVWWSYYTFLTFKRLCVSVCVFSWVHICVIAGKCLLFVVVCRLPLLRVFFLWVFKRAYLQCIVDPDFSCTPAQDFKELW
jgi:hypothetical protein